MLSYHFASSASFLFVTKLLPSPAGTDGVAGFIEKVFVLLRVGTNTIHLVVKVGRKATNFDRKYLVCLF